MELVSCFEDFKVSFSRAYSDESGWSYLKMDVHGAYFGVPLEEESLRFGIGLCFRNASPPVVFS